MAGGRAPGPASLLEMSGHPQSPENREEPQGEHDGQLGRRRVGVAAGADTVGTQPETGSAIGQVEEDEEREGGQEHRQQRQHEPGQAKSGPLIHRAEDNPRRRQVPSPGIQSAM